MEWTLRASDTELDLKWSGTIVCLTVPTETDLYHYMMEFWDLDPAPFYEPDIGNELSAFAVLLNEIQAKTLSDLPLAGSHESHPP